MLEKHPGTPNQRKKKRSPAEMATLRVAEKAAQDARVTAKLAVSLVITGVKDSMVAADEAHKQDAMQPVPMKITQIVCPL